MYFDIKMKDGRGGNGLVVCTTVTINTETFLDLHHNPHVCTSAHCMPLILRYVPSHESCMQQLAEAWE